MESRRKIAALFFAVLVIFINATYYSTTQNRKINNEESKEVCFIPASEANSFSMQNKTSSPEYQGWKVEVRFHGFCSQDKFFSGIPQLKMIRKTFVVDTFSYKPCKSIILFPYHEFT